MDFGSVIVIFIIGFIIYKIFGGGSSSSKKRRKRAGSQPPVDDRFTRRATGRGSTHKRSQSPNTRNSFIQSAKRQENLANYDEASRLYLRGGQVFSAAKMKAMKGPAEIGEAINLIRINSPDQLEMITRNLVNEFYYRLELPATAAALLRGIGLVGEAEAVEIAANISYTSTDSTPAQIVDTPLQFEEPVIQGIPEPVAASSIEQESVVDTQIIEESISQSSSTIATEQVSEVSTPVGEIQNTLMMASMELSDNCVLCKRKIKSGSSFLQCINCGKPGHYKHLAEIMKVTGKCPYCKERLVISMYDL